MIGVNYLASYEFLLLKVILVSEIFEIEFLCLLLKCSALSSLVTSPTLLFNVAIDKSVRPIQKD